MMRINNCEQGSGEWFRLRLGMATASEFATIMASGKDGGASKTRRTYLLKLAGELLTGEPMDSFSNVHMERGKAMEEEARAYYSFMADEAIARVGFVAGDTAGCSPDGLIGERGLLQIKTALPHRLIELLLKDEFPPEHKAQCQGELWITERDWTDIAVYWPKLPLFVKRIWREDAYIAKLANAVDVFNAELADVVKAVRAYGCVEADARPLTCADDPPFDHTDMGGIPAFLRRPTVPGVAHAGA